MPKRKREPAPIKGGIKKQKKGGKPLAPLVRYGYRMNDTELKVFDIAVGSLAANTTGSIALLCAPIPGAAINERIGRKITLKSFFVRGCVFADQSRPMATGANTSSQLARMMLVWDETPNGVTPAITDILTQATSQSQLNINFRDRFRILWDKTWALDPITMSTTATQSVASAGRSLYPVKKWKKLNHEMIFNAGIAGTIADVVSGALFLVTIGMNGAGADDGTFSVSTRIRYSDA